MASPIHTQQQPACVYYGKDVRLAVTGSSGILGSVMVSIGADQTMYPMGNGNLGRSVYDTILNGGFIYLAPNTNRVISAHSNRYTIDIVENLATDVEFDRQNKRYLVKPDAVQQLKNAQGNTVHLRHIARSNNGKWMVLYHANYGVAKLNTETREVTVVDTHLVPDYQYHWAATISDDGRYIAVHAGYSSQGGSIRVIDTAGSCGSAYGQHGSSSHINCPRGHHAYPNWAMNQNWWSHVDRMHFASDNSELKLVTVHHEIESGVFAHKHLSMYASGHQPPKQLDYLALGDSYSSGEGDTERDKATGKKYYRDYTDNEEDKNAGVPREKCHISTRSYPYTLSQGMDLGDARESGNTKWQTVACSGAEMYDAKEVNSPDYKGQGKGGGEGGKPRLEGYDNWQVFKSTALNDFIPGRHKQIEFVKKYQPKVITLTMGGNDVGFGEKIGVCASPFPFPNTCEHVESRGKARLATQVSGQYDNLRSLYTELYEASGRQAKMYVLGYPQFISKEEMSACGGIASLNYAERQMIYHSVTYMNNVIKTAAVAAGVKYIDIENSLGDHKLCDSGEKYVTGVVGLPISIKNSAQESFHPNAKGHFKIAMTVWDKVDSQSLLDYDICPNTDANLCPDSAATKESIFVPSYFQGLAEEKRSAYQRMTSNLAKKGSPARIITNSYTFRPHSSVNVTMYSEPTDLGDYTATANGSLEEDIVIPDSLTAGYHTLVVSGETHSGEPIELEQVVLVHGADPDDIDENGLSDSQQPCGAFMPLNEADANLDASCSSDTAKSENKNRKNEINTPDNPQDKSSPNADTFRPSKSTTDANQHENSHDDPESIAMIEGSRDRTKEPSKSVLPQSASVEDRSVFVSSKTAGWHMLGGGVLILGLVSIIGWKIWAKNKKKSGG